MRQQDDSVNRNQAEVEDGIAEAIHALRHAFRSRQLRAPSDGDVPLVPMEGRALSYVARHPGAMQSDLASQWGRDKAQIARLVQGLKERGLITSTPDACDRRAQRLILTEAGETAHRAIRKHKAQVARQAVTDLDEGERATLLALLNRVLRNLTD